MFSFVPLGLSPLVTNPKAMSVLLVPSPGRFPAKVTWPELWSTAPSQAEQMVPSAHIMSDWYRSEGEILAAKHTNCQLQSDGQTYPHIFPVHFGLLFAWQWSFFPPYISVSVVLCFFSTLLFLFRTQIFTNTLDKAESSPGLWLRVDIWINSVSITFILKVLVDLVFHLRSDPDVSTVLLSACENESGCIYQYFRFATLNSSHKRMSAEDHHMQEGICGPGFLHVHDGPEECCTLFRWTCLCLALWARAAMTSPWKSPNFRGAIRAFNICLPFCPTCIKC